MAEVHLLVSPRGGRGRAAAAAPIVRSVIERAGHTPVDISGDSAEASAEAVRAAVAAGAERVIAVGGDGTLHLALQGVVGTDAVLGVVPVGTGNDYARAFGLFGLSVEEAAARALGPSRPVDAISTDRQRWVAFSVTGGFSVDVNVRADRMRFPRGPSRYTAATLLTMPGLRHRELVVTVDGQRTELRSALFAVNNTPTFGGGMAICPDADPGDGMLDACVVGPASRTTMLRLLPKVFDGGHVGHGHVHMLRGRTVTIEGEPTDLVGDGEPIGATPITLEVVPGAVSFAGGG
ncbi:MAG: sphingosine kinase [Acidimicrobiaceae bacterium]|nr:diacylglycerol kinase family protein [Acidimicrobiaceae bacterium]MDE0495395.1 diacylglycerol kinase family protein [Acidimicrobiaceae bacterium]MXY12303.1 sphingosine kinase [Acidimicrobiaceae bacterium]MXZ66503.1 sphingosine kinase [Acidimicrobiaceae bacterium]MYA15249.1 sphingosine kinase [Acidimicrobiaceae bacterium]